MSGNDFKVALMVNSKALEEKIRASLSKFKGVSVVDGPVSGSTITLICELGADPTGDLAQIENLINRGVVGEILLLSEEKDPDLLLQAMRLGVREFLASPPDDEDLDRVLDRLVRRAGNKTAKLTPKGRIIDVFGCKGGVGSTTVAVNLASELNTILSAKGGSVAVLDMNIPYGEVPFFLDIDPEYNWGEAARNLDRLDETYLMSIMTRHSSGLYVLPAPSTFEDSREMTAEHLEQILLRLSAAFDLVVVDGGGYLDDFSLKAMQMSNQIFLVSVLSLPCLSNIKRFQETVGSVDGVSLNKVRLTFNRHMSKSEISVADAEQTIGMKADWLIPNDYETTMSAINQGRLLREVDPKSALTKSMAKMAARLAGNGKKKGLSKSRGKSRGFGLFKKAPAI